MTTNPAYPFEPADWYDAWGHRWRWMSPRALWVHDRDRCVLVDGRPCKATT